MSAANIGWLFYRDYYKDIDGDFTIKSNSITGKVLKDYNIPNYESVIDGLMTISLRTTYPGLLIGSGYQHNIKSESAFKVGFCFDYSSGLPVIPGSSVKGLLRSVFPFHRKDFGDEFQTSRIGYLNEILLKENIIGTELKNEEIKVLELEIFEGLVNDKNVEIGKRDLFLDAFPKESFKHSGKFLSNDYITHHKNPLQNPNPVMFLKVLPEVEFTFNFKLCNSEVVKGFTAENKLELFKQILLDLGIGAKTNVGYGQLDLSKKDKEELERTQAIQKQEQAEQARKAELVVAERQKAEIEANKSEAQKRIRKDEVLECRVSKVEDKKKGSCFFKFDWDNDLEFHIKKQKLKVDLKPGDVVKIKIIEDYYVCKEVRFFNSITKI